VSEVTKTEQAEELRQAAQRFFRRFGALASSTTPCGKPLSMAHAHALMVLLAGGELSQQRLGGELRIDKSNVARLCAKMVEEGQARQRACKEDGRSRLVSLTAKGEKLAREVEAASRERFGALLRGIPESHRSEVIQALQLLTDALDSMPTAVAPEERVAE
jgi:DNA-binding MarR family transcriptional regulator